MPVWDRQLSLSHGDRRKIGDDTHVQSSVGRLGCSLAGRSGDGGALWNQEQPEWRRLIGCLFYGVHECKLMPLHGFIRKSRHVKEREIELTAGQVRGLR